MRAHLTLQAPELQHQRAALQVVEQALGGVEGGKVNSVIQQRVDIVPHSRGVQRLAAVEQPETDRTGQRLQDSRRLYKSVRDLCCLTLSGLLCCGPP